MSASTRRWAIATIVMGVATLIALVELISVALN